MPTQSAVPTALPENHVPLPVASAFPGLRLAEVNSALVGPTPRTQTATPSATARRIGDSSASGVRHGVWPQTPTQAHRDHLDEDPREKHKRDHTPPRLGGRDDKPRE